MNKIDNFPVSVNIVNLIREGGLSVKKVAERAGISEYQFREMLEGRRVITPSDIKQICVALGVDANTLFK